MAYISQLIPTDISHNQVTGLVHMAVIHQKFLAQHTLRPAADLSGVGGWSIDPLFRRQSIDGWRDNL